MAYDPGEGTGGTDSPFVPLYLPEGRPVIEYVRTYDSVSFDFEFEFRPIAFENWNEAIEGDNTIDVLIDASTYENLMEHYDGPYSMIISLIASGRIRRRIDIAYGGSGYTWSSL